jgi:cation:H+ antiporter
MLLVLYLGLLIFFSFLLIKATEILVEALNNLAKISRMRKFALTSFLLALATSLPEIFVGVTAALEGKPSLALGNILGSNIANLSLVIGGAAMIGGTLAVSGEFLTRDLFYGFLAGVLPMILLIDDKLSQVEGLMLLAIYGVYNFTILKGKHKGMRQPGLIKKMMAKFKDSQADRQIAWVFFGAALLIFSADGLVKTGTLIAKRFQVPVFMIGLFLVSVGTSLPELSFELKAITKKEVGMVFGDLLGSIVANSTLVLGLTALIEPIVLQSGFEVYLTAAIAFVLVFFFFWVFVRTKKKLERWEGVVLFLIYLLFVIFEFWRVGGELSHFSGH